MSKLRSVSTAFWSDPFIEDLTPSEKLLFLYLITNDKTNMLGIYEVSIKKISFDTGLNKEVIDKALKEFERLSKVKYVKNHIILVNFMKHQNYNTNMKKSAIDIYNDLPNELKDNDLIISKDNPIKGFESLLNHYGMVSKYEVEDEIELEEEKENNIEPINWPVLLDFFNKTTGKKCKLVSDKAKKQFNARLKDKYTKQDIANAIINVCNNQYHIDSNLEHVTLEFISRPDKFEKYSQIKNNLNNGTTNQKLMKYDDSGQLL